MREILSDRDTRSLLTAQWIAQTADGLVQATFANVLILEPEGTVGRILGVSVLTLVPYSIIAPFMGVFVDRWRRRNILVGSNIARIVLLGSLALIAGTTDEELPLYAGLLGLLGLGRLFLTTKGAVLPFLLHDKHLLQGNALSGGAGMIAALVGGVAGIATLAVLDTANSFLVGAALYAISAYIAQRISHPMGHEIEATEDLGRAAARVWRELLDGVREVASRPQARLPLVGVFVVRVAAMVSAITAIIIIKDNFPDAGDEFGRLSSSALALGAAGVGAFLGALIAPALGRRFNEPRLMLFGFVLAGAGIAALGGIPAMGAVLTLTLLGGFGGFIAKVSVDAQVQRALPDDFRGRAFSLYDILYNLATVVAAALLIGSEDSLRIFSVALGLTILFFAWMLRQALERAGLLAAGPGS